jgi:hypothetical protein
MKTACATRPAPGAARCLAVAALALAALPAGAAQARTVTIHQRPAPQATVTVPAGWTAHSTSRFLRLTRGRDRVRVRTCLLDREERDMTGRHAAGLTGRRRGLDVWGLDGFYVAAAAGGGCISAEGGRVARSVAQRLHARLGPDGPAPASDASAEAMARAARTRTLGQPRAQGTAFAIPFDLSARIDSTWEWDLPAGYSHQLAGGMVNGQRVQYEVMRDTAPDGNHLKVSGRTCWTHTSAPDEDDALEPRLELHEWDAPPSTATAWRVAYAPPAPQPDGSTLLSWTGFVADGSALIGPDGLLRAVRIVDHHQAMGRTVWRIVEVAFTAFPAQIAPVAPVPACA